MLPKRYNLDNVQRVKQRPSLLKREMGRLTSKISFPIYNKYFEYKYGRGIDIMDQDWDNLIILDACRYDIFSQRNTIDGSLKPALSQGTHSWEFLQSNFVGDHHHDTVHITENPHAKKIPGDTFHYMEINFARHVQEETVQIALDAHDEYPNKRLIVHLMPPHAPYYGPTAENIRENLGFGIPGESEGNRLEKRIRKAVVDGDVSQSDFVQCYEENVDIAVNHAQSLVDGFTGKTVITADHGEMLGEKAVPFTHRLYGHPHHISTRNLRVVPWLEIESDSRKNIEPAPPVGTKQPNDDLVDDRLEALGYK